MSAKIRIPDEFWVYNVKISVLSRHNVTVLWGPNGEHEQ